MCTYSYVSFFCVCSYVRVCLIDDLFKCMYHAFVRVHLCLNILFVCVCIYRVFYLCVCLCVYVFTVCARVCICECVYFTYSFKFILSYIMRVHLCLHIVSMSSLLLHLCMCAYSCVLFFFVCVCIHVCVFAYVSVCSINNHNCSRITIY